MKKTKLKLADAEAYKRGYAAIVEGEDAKTVIAESVETHIEEVFEGTYRPDTIATGWAVIRRADISYVTWQLHRTWYVGRGFMKPRVKHRVYRVVAYTRGGDAVVLEDMVREKDVPAAVAKWGRIVFEGARYEYPEGAMPKEEK